MIINYQLDGGPFKFAGFVAHDLRLRFGSLNYAQGGNINLQRPIAAAATALNSLPLSGGICCKTILTPGERRFFQIKPTSGILIQETLLSDSIIAHFWGLTAHRPSFATQSGA